MSRQTREGKYLTNFPQFDIAKFKICHRREKGMTSKNLLYHLGTTLNLLH